MALREHGALPAYFVDEPELTLADVGERMTNGRYYRYLAVPSLAVAVVLVGSPQRTFSQAYVGQTNQGRGGAYITQMPESARTQAAAMPAARTPAKVGSARRSVELISPQQSRSTPSSPREIRAVASEAERSPDGAIIARAIVTGRLPTVARGVAFILPAKDQGRRLPSVGPGTVNR